VRLLQAKRLRRRAELVKEARERKEVKAEKALKERRTTSAPSPSRADPRTGCTSKVSTKSATTTSYPRSPSRRIWKITRPGTT
jgi:hypothetical protein